MIAPSDSYSSSVKAELLVGDRTFNVAQLRPGKCVLRNPEKMEPAEGEIVLCVDESVYRRRVYLTHGISAESGDVSFEQL